MSVSDQSRRLRFEDGEVCALEAGCFCLCDGDFAVLLANASSLLRTANAQAAFSMASADLKQWN